MKLYKILRSVSFKWR